MSIEDFRQFELDSIQKAVNTRWRKQTIELMLADIETRLSDFSKDLTLCPAAVWEVDNCSFVIIKSGENQYRAQFFYDTKEQYKAGASEYHDLDDCVTSLLKLQADHEAQRQQQKS